MSEKLTSTDEIKEEAEKQEGQSAEGLNKTSEYLGEHKNFEQILKQAYSSFMLTDNKETTKTHGGADLKNSINNGIEKYVNPAIEQGQNQFKIGSEISDIGKSEMQKTEELSKHLSSFENKLGIGLNDASEQGRASEWTVDTGEQTKDSGKKTEDNARGMADDLGKRNNV